MNGKQQKQLAVLGPPERMGKWGLVPSHKGLSTLKKYHGESPSSIQGVSTKTCILHFALAGRNMQASFGLKVVWES